MKRNVGGLDRFFRFGIGFLSLAIVLATENLILQIVFSLVAVGALGTAFTGRCPLNARLGVDTTTRKPT